MRAKNLALRVLSTAAMLSIVTSIAAPAFAATYYINEGSVDVTVSDAGVVTVKQGNDTYTDGLDSVIIRGGTRSKDETDDRIKADASPATQEADGSNTPAVNETEAPKSENTAGDDVSTPKLYVIDLASTQVLFDETRQDDTVTYTTKQDGASLTGSFEALEAMAADGVKTIVFQTIGTNTPGAVSRVSVNALLQHGGETLLLTHNGTEVHLTIDGQNADSLLLQ